MEINCVVKLYYNRDNTNFTPCPKEISCQLSLKTSDSTHYILLESKTNSKKYRYTLKPDCVADIVTRRLDEGHLTIAFKNGHVLDQLVVSQAEDKESLRLCVEDMMKICFGDTRRQLPLSPPVTPEREVSGSALSAKRKLALHLPLRQSPSAERSGLKPAQFYSSSVLSTASSLPPSPQKTVTSTNYRRSLVAPSDVLTTSPSRPAAKRLPLAVLSEFQGAAKKQRGSYPSIGEADEVEGFANLGNTCYMNAVLQSLLGLDPFAEDLYNQALVKKVPSKSLYMLLYLLLKSKRAKESYESQCVLLTNIKQIIAQSAAKFSDSRQQDAHELLAQCLDQLKQDTTNIDMPEDGKSNKVSLSPVVRNFECEIMHTITCKGCGKITQKPEIIYDFALQLPRSVILKPTEQANLQQLFNLYFACEDVEYNCSACANKTATLSHQLSKLPRVLIIYLKRYGYNSHTCKRIDSIHIPRIINAGPCCLEGVGLPFEFSGPWPRDSVEVSEEKENMFAGVSVKVENTNGHPTPTVTHSVGTTESATLSPIATSKSPDSGVSVTGSMVLSCVNSEAATPKPTPTSTPTSLQPSPTCGKGSSERSNQLCVGDGDGDGDGLFRRSIPRDPLHSNKTDSLSSPLYMAEKVLGSGRPSGGMVGVATDRRVSEGEGGGGGSYTKFPTLKKLPYLKRIKRTPSSGSTKAAVSDIVDEFDKLCESIDDNGSIKKLPLEDTPAIKQEHVLHDGSSSSLIPNGEHQSNGNGLNGTQSEDQSGGFGRTGNCITGHMTNGHSHMGNGHLSNGHTVNGYHHAVNANSCSPVSDNGTRDGVGSNDDPCVHIMDLEEEENEQLKRALEESARSQPAELVHLQELGMSEEDQLKLALELSIQESSSVEDIVPLPAAVTSDLPVPVTPDHEMLTFRLMSIVNHIGKGSGGGHYITDVNCVHDGTWKSFNDSTVVEMKEEDVRQRRQCTGYIFFYMYKFTYQSVVRYAKAS